MNQTFGAFIERTHLKKDNICLYASLHEDTDHRHIHFAFFEEEPKRRDKNGVLGYTKKGLIDARAFDNYLVSADMHLSEHADEYYKARDKALDELKIIRRTQTTKKRNVKLNREIKSLLEKLPKRGRLQYNSPNMAPYRDEIDRVADLIIQGNKGVSTAHGTMLKQFARIDQEVLELVKDNIPVTLITDGMCSYFMRNKMIDIVVVGADRIAANGDTANKIGTSTVAIAAKYYNIPFYAAAPKSTIDLSIESGNDIIIELRDEEEVTMVNGKRICAEGVKIINPSFDVTDNSLIAGIITEDGIFKPEELKYKLKVSA